MKKSAAIACDSWKISTFEKILDDAGYEFETITGITPDTRIIKVMFDSGDFRRLTATIQHCQRKAAELKN